MNCALCKTTIFPKMPTYTSSSAFLKGLAILCPNCIKHLNDPKQVQIKPELKKKIYLKVNPDDEFFVSRLGALRDEIGFYIESFHDKYSNYL